MNKLNKYIERKKSILTGKANLEHLHTLKDFPVFMGCTDMPEEEDIVADMSWAIDPDTGVIQLDKLIPLEVLYLNQHNDGTGKVWKDMYQQFADFVAKHVSGGDILEIGGAHDEVARRVLEQAPSTKWTIVEPNPEHIEDEQITVIHDWFDASFKLPEGIDTIVHSHVFEHVFNPKEFIGHIASALKPGQKHIFAFPNLQPMLEKRFTNAINFEHTIFLTEYFADYILEQAGFHIIEKKYFGDPHSIFYATEKLDQKHVSPAQLENKYDEYKSAFLDFVQYHEDLVKELNEKMATTETPVYLFGAHIFSLFLLGFGLDASNIVSVLDNSPLKQGKRLYGTNFTVESPKVLAGKGKVAVILKAGIYNEEIKKDILENINSDVTFW